MGRIKRLTPDLINKIAAGEVVERPASVVKELAENAIDAKASTIRVQLSEGGLNAITIIDDGHGMSDADARLSLERHATSKLPDQEALFQIITKGFRGEALPTIASVSRFTLQTSEPGAVAGTKVSFDDQHEIVVEPAPALGGTRIDVLDLFYNTPARRKFLKRESTELAHCEEAVIRLALAHPEVGFFVEHGERRLFSSPAALKDERERIAAALGSEVAPHLLAIEERRLGVTVTGFVASPEFTFATARGLYTFVNHRYIRDRGLNSAIQRAFQDSLPPGRQPVAVIHIEVDPRAVDVNVHPQKLEVRFADPRSVQEAVGAAIARALKAAPWRQGLEPQNDQATHAHYAMAVDRFLSRASPSLFEPSPSVEEGQHPGFGTARPDINTAPPAGFFATLRYLGELGRRFWVCEGQGGTLVIIDPRAARERLLLQALTESFEDGALERAPATLFSATVELPFDDAKLIVSVAPALLKVGIEVEAFGGDSIAVRRVPAALEAVNLRDLLLELADAMPLRGDDFGPALKVMASHATEGPMRTVSHDEAHSVLGQLDALDFSIATEHSKVVVRQTPLLELVGIADEGPSTGLGVSRG